MACRVFLRVLSVVGARPNFYDGVMSDQFVGEPEIPRPNVNLGAGAGSHTVETAEVMRGLEPILERPCPDWVLLVGDVNFTLGATQLCVPVAHVEAGLSR